MKSFIIACVVAIVVAVIGAIGLNIIQEPVDEGVRHERRASRRISSGRSADERCVGKEADAGPRLDCRYVFRKFQ